MVGAPRRRPQGGAAANARPGLIRAFAGALLGAAFVYALLLATP